MKIKKFFIICLGFLFVSLTGFAKDFSIQVEDITVTIDHIIEQDVAIQLEEMARLTLFNNDLNQENNKDVDNLFLKVKVVQRSFYKDIDNMNSIYVHGELFDNEGKKVREHGFYSETKSSIVSSVRQKKEVEKIVRDVKKYIKEMQKVNG